MQIIVHVLTKEGVIIISYTHTCSAFLCGTILSDYGNAVSGAY